MKKFTSTFLVVVLIAISLLNSCSNSNEKEAKKDSLSQTDGTKSEENANTNSTKKKYSFKSGKITSSSQMMGMQQSMVTYFDDYGAKECIETSAEIMGQKILNRTILLEEYIYQIDMLKKNGFKTKKNTSMPGANIDFSKLSDEMLTNMKMKKVGTENFLGKTCDKYTIDSEMMKGYFLVWNNIPLKTEGEAMKIKMKIEAQKIEENAVVPAEVFEIPAGFTISER